VLFPYSSMWICVRGHLRSSQLVPFDSLLWASYNNFVSKITQCFCHNNFWKVMDCLEQIQTRATKLVKGFKELTWTEWNIFDGETEATWGLDWVNKILNEEERVDKTNLLQFALETHIEEAKMQQNERTTAPKIFFLDNIIDNWNRLKQYDIDSSSVKSQHL